MIPHVIVNPASASGETATVWPRLASELRNQLGAFQVSFTERPGDAVFIAAEAAARGTELIIACGGDGTVSEVANGILNSGKMASLGILPAGTGGDFRKTLGISATAREAAKVLRGGITRAIDVGRVSFIGENGIHQSRYFLGVASFGISARVVKRVRNGESAKSLRGQMLPFFGGRISYGVAMLREAMQSLATRVLVQLDDESESCLTVTTLCVANARYFGGGMKIAPRAVLDDGKFDVVAIGGLSALQLVTNAPRIYAGAHLGMEQVQHALAAKVSVRPAEDNCELDLEVDGELPGRLPATFQVVRSALQVRCAR